MKSKILILFSILTFSIFAQDKIINNNLKKYVHSNTTNKKNADKIYNSILESSIKHKVDPKIIASIIKVESNFNPHLTSPKGAIGLMQLMPATAKSLNSNPRDIKSNISGGTEYFAWCLEQNKSLPLALASYNAGYGNVKKHKGIPPFKETQNFVKKVLNIYNTSFEV